MKRSSPTSTSTSSSSSSIYAPTHPPGSRVLLQIPADDFTTIDHALVTVSSLLIVGSVVWFPMLAAWAWRRYRQIPAEDHKRKRIYRTILLLALAVVVVGPHRYPQVGKWIRIKEWPLWKSWLRFVALEVILDTGKSPSSTEMASSHPSSASSSLSSQPLQASNTSSSSSFPVDTFTKDQAILAIIPHGIFPFGLGLSVLPAAAARAFGEFRPVVATATALLPLVRSLLSWIGAVDATRSSVDRALSQGARLGLAPGGIAEMFEGYPKPLTHPDDEYSIVRRGFLKLALQHQIPVIPIYCFGSTKLLRRLQLPQWVERLSLLLRVSICIFFGKWGLPIPFRQKLLYVMGNPIVPPPLTATTQGGSGVVDQQVDEMHTQFCNELLRLFEAHKESYGWGRKTLRIIDGS